MPFPNCSGIIVKLGELLVKEGVFLYGTDDKIKWINTELTRIQCFLQDAELKWKNGDACTINWVKEITCAGREIEDLIDLIQYKNEIRRRRKGFIGTMSRYAYFPAEIITLHKVGSKVDSIKAKLEDISKSKDKYEIISTGNRGNEEARGGDDMIHIERFHSPHFVDDMDVVGFDGYMNELIARLLNQGNPARNVVSIVGMGGLGKTTLTRKIFHSSQVKENFPTSAWIAVSQKNILINLLKEIARKVMDLGKGDLRRSEGESSSSLSIEKINAMEELELKREIFEFLQGRKYLVVLDDVWSMDDWEKICHIFPDSSNGSKILLTTRDRKVAEHADPRSTPFELQVLSDVESWELLYKKIFPKNYDFKVTDSKELEVLGRKLASRCGGLPLALVVLGGLLHRNVNRDSWSEMLDTMNWESMTNGQRCLEILALSYKDLPSYHIKSCLLYISTFPKDCLIAPAKLIRLWIAEGLIPTNERSTLEEIARGLISLFSRRKDLQYLKLYGTIPYFRYESIYFPPNLTELTLKMSRLREDPMPVLGKMPCLLLLRLGIESYEGTQLSCDGDQFPRLKHLSLEWKFILKGWHIEHGAMPVLATLHINGCFYMDKIPVGLKLLIDLKELRLSDIPPKTEKRAMKDEGEDWPIIKHIPSIILRRAW